MRILLVGGLSAGHLSPLLAVAEEAKRRDPGCQTLFVCSKKESDIAFLNAAHVTHATVTHPTRSVRALIDFPKALHDARRVLSTFHPDVIFSKGGAVSLPLCLIAWGRDIPIVLHESDAVMGLANRIISVFAKKVCLGFPQIKKETLHSSLFTLHSIVTGNPIRSFIKSGNKAKGLQVTSFSGKRPILLIMGGSQGAAEINRVVLQKLDELLALCDIIHITGKGKETATNKKGYRPFSFVNEELPHLYACATIALSRAGAGAISELATWAIPTILVPLSGLAQDHQTKNAEFLSATHAAQVLEQNILEQKLVATVQNLISNESSQKAMGATLQSLMEPDAARLLADTIFKCISTPERNTK